MNYTKILEELNQATSFDLFRLKCVIDKQLDDPQRIFNIKKKLFIGQTISYFDEEENRPFDATVLEMKRTRVLVRNLCDGHRWNLLYYHINLNHVDTKINKQATQKLDRNTLKVGDKVSFFCTDGSEKFGEVFKLNPKTAGVLIEGAKWRVSYGALSSIIDGELGNEFIEHDG